MANCQVLRTLSGFSKKKKVVSMIFLKFFGKPGFATHNYTKFEHFFV